MIFYATKKMMECYDILDDYQRFFLPDEKEKAGLKRQEEDDMFKWGANVFTFEGMTCLQLMNFTSKLSLFLFNIKKGHLPHLNKLVAYYLNDIYKDRPEASVLQKKLEAGMGTSFERLSGKHVMSSMVHVMNDDMKDGERFYRFVVDKKLQVKELNRWITLDRNFVDKEGVTFIAGERFGAHLLEKFSAQ